MTGLPGVQVLLDDGTGTFPYDITSKALIADGISHSHGREDWQGGVTAGELSLTLDNSDGRFTPGNTTIASPSPITVDQKIRIKETVNATTYTRFTGYVKSWPVAWPATVSTFATVRLSATDAQARAERRVLRSVVEEEILADSPSAYYTLGEPAGAVSAGDTSGAQAPALTQTGNGANVVFGSATGPGTDGLTAATFAGGQYLTSGTSITTSVLECFFSRSGAPGTGEVLLGSSGGGVIGIGTDGKIHTSAADLSSPVVTDGATHHLSWQSGHVLLDGVDIGSPTSTPSATSVLTVGYGVGAAGGPSAVFSGVIAHVAAFSTLSTTRAAAHATAGSTGFAGESGTARITRLAGYASLPVGTLDTSLTNVAFVDFTNSEAWPTLQDAIDAEGGVAFVNGSGNLTFHNRNKVSLKTAPDLTLDKAYVTADVQPVTDDQQILNYIEATAQTTGVAQLVRSTTSETSHGRYSDSKTYLVQTDAEALDRANWIIGNFAEPTTRYGTLTINLYRMTSTQQKTVLDALDMNCWLQITGMPSQTPGSTTADVVVEGWAEEVSSDSWLIRCNVVSRSLFNAWILDDTTYSVLDSTTRLYV